MKAWWLAGGLISAWGCSFTLDWNQAGLPCDASQPCGQGFACVAGKCQPGDGGVPPAPDAGPGVDAGTDAGPTGTDGGCSSDAGLDQDPRNCGACGHDCGGGQCAAGQCTPYQLVAAPAAWALGLDRTAVVWDTNATDGGIWRTANDGSSQSTLVSNRPTRALILADGGAYWSPPSPALGLWRVDAAGGPVQTLQTAYGTDVFAADSSFLFWTGKSGVFTYYLFRSPLDAGQLGTPFFADALPTLGMAVDETDFYWTNTSGRLAVLPKNAALGSVPRTLVAAGAGPVVASRASLYFGADGGVWAFPLPLPTDGGAPAGPTLVASSELPTALAVDALGVYWATPSALTWLPFDGGAAVTLPARATPVQIATDPQALYWTENGPDGGLNRWIR